MNATYAEHWPQFYTATINNWQHLLADDKHKDIIISSLKFFVSRRAAQQPNAAGNKFDENNYSIREINRGLVQPTRRRRGGGIRIVKKKFKAGRVSNSSASQRLPH